MNAKIQSEIEEKALEGYAKVTAEKQDGADRVAIRAEGSMLNVMSLSVGVISSVCDKILKYSDVGVLLAYKHALMTLFDGKIIDTYNPDDADADSEDMSDPDNMERLLNAMFGIDGE